MAGANGNNGRIVYEDLVYNRWVGVLLAMGRWRAYRPPVNRIHACVCGFGRQFHQRNIHSYSRDSSYIHVYVKFLLLADFLASETGIRVLASGFGNALAIGIRGIRVWQLAPVDFCNHA